MAAGPSGRHPRPPPHQRDPCRTRSPSVATHALDHRSSSGSSRPCSSSCSAAWAGCRARRWARTRASRRRAPNRHRRRPPRRLRPRPRPRRPPTGRRSSARRSRSTAAATATASACRSTARGRALAGGIGDDPRPLLPRSDARDDPAHDADPGPSAAPVARDPERPAGRVRSSRAVDDRPRGRDLPARRRPAGDPEDRRLDDDVADPRDLRLRTTAVRRPEAEPVRRPRRDRHDAAPACSKPWRL